MMKMISPHWDRWFHLSSTIQYPTIITSISTTTTDKITTNTKTITINIFASVKRLLMHNTVHPCKQIRNLPK